MADSILFSLLHLISISMDSRCFSTSFARSVVAENCWPAFAAFDAMTSSFLSHAERSLSSSFFCILAVSSFDNSNTFSRRMFCCSILWLSSSRRFFFRFMADSILFSLLHLISISMDSRCFSTSFARSVVAENCWPAFAAFDAMTSSFLSHAERSLSSSFFWIRFSSASLACW